FMRYFIGQPLQWTEEMSGMLMIWVVMLGGVVAERDRGWTEMRYGYESDGWGREKLRSAGLSCRSESVAVRLFLGGWLVL
ncbi:TRAP transporter small permease subunit, partial [Escherichia coli]|nr:TRAP transporter small permease subunit [Escherichia coli]